MRRRIAAVMATFLIAQGPLGIMRSNAAGLPVGTSSGSGGAVIASGSDASAEADAALPGEGDGEDATGDASDAVLPDQETDGAIVPDKGTGSGTSGGTSKEEVIASPSDAVREGEEGKGRLQIDIDYALHTAKTEWNVELFKLDKDGAEEEARTRTAVGGDNESSAHYTLDGLARGTYRLRMTPENADTAYLPYEQDNIKINDNQVTLRLMNDDPEVYGYKKAAADKIGVLKLGDINHDEVLDVEDQKELLALVADPNVSVAENALADLNQDDEIDLVDASVFAKFYGTKDKKAETVSAPIILADEVKASTSDATKVVEGSMSIEEAFAGGNPSDEAAVLQLATENGEDISEENPIELSSEYDEPKRMAGFTIDPVEGSANTIVDAEIDVWEDGATKPTTIVFKDGKQVKKGLRALAGKLRAALFAADDNGAQGGALVVDLGGQIAVKKVSIRVSKTLAKQGEAKLVDISKVTFLNNMEDRIPEPELSIPDRVVVENADQSFTVTWRKQPNISMYELTVSGEVKGGAKKTMTKQVEVTKLEVSDIDGSDLVNGKTYQITLRSVNGAWKSQSTEAKGEPYAMTKPPAPEEIEITEGYQRLSLKWKTMRSTDSYNLYYREKGAETYEKVADIEATSYVLKNLKDETTYELYMTGNNRLGEGDESVHQTAKTITMNLPITPKYQLINTDAQGDEEHTAHIEAVKNNGADETVPSEFAVVDNNYATAWVRNDWDAGHHYPGGSTDKSPIVTLDGEYKMDTFVIIPDEDQKFDLSAATLFYWSEGVAVSESTKTAMSGRMSKKISENGKPYFVFETDEPVEAKSVQIASTTGYNRRISYAELKFYYYDPLEDDIEALYADTLHVSLKEGVTQDDIDALRARINTVDEVSGEYHPKRAYLETELANAERILKDGGLQVDILKVDNKDTKNADSHITFKGGLNVFQPLGVTVAAGESITIYVGGPKHKIGDNTNLELVQTQYHGTSAKWQKSLGRLKAGANEFTITAIDNMDVERGGQLYIKYTGNKGAEEYGVRVSGGTKIPVLDLSDMRNESKEKRVALAKTYIESLEAMQESLREKHDADHKDYAWDEKNCIYGATDIVTRYAMFSSATQQILAGLGDGSLDARAEKLEQSIQAMDDMVELYYQHKGLSEDPDAPAHNKMPIGRLNFRYQRMFDGAFMYAGGEHIGIEWNEQKAYANGVPVTLDETGAYKSGQLFGWGIGHEIGHEINESAYTVVEVTNNYFAQLSASRDNNESARWDYDDLYKKVSSGTPGKSSNGAVKLGMYWQLHLAYDFGGHNYKIYEKNKEQLANLFFARVDSYVRKPDSAPAPKDIKLNLNDADVDNKLMRLATAAAEKNILEFFKRWGFEPNAETIAYAEQFPEETRGIWYVNDDLHRKLVDAKAQPSAGTNNSTVDGSIAYENGSNEVNISIKSSGSNWIYEIRRYERIGNSIERRPVGYAYANADGSASYTDVIGTVNNRAFTYEVVGYDENLNPTAVKELGSVKVSHRGDLDRALWTVSSNLTNENLELPNEEHPDSSVQPDLDLMINGEGETFVGASASADPEIILELNQPEVVTGLVYTADEVEGAAPIAAFKVYVSEDGNNWTEVKKTVDSFALESGSQTVWFNDGKQLYTYDAAFVKFVASGQKGKQLAVTDLSLLGQTGDDVALSADGMGVLAADYVYDDKGGTIPAGSVVFTDTYKGNPAYNVVLLYDENGMIVGGEDADGNINAVQLILAPEPENNGMLGEVSEGRWIYYIDKAQADSFKAKQVRAELYRVDNAETNEGQRLVSTTLFVDVPEKLPALELKKQAAEAAYRRTAISAALAETALAQKTKQKGDER